MSLDQIHSRPEQIEDIIADLQKQLLQAPENIRAPIQAGIQKLVGFIEDPGARLESRSDLERENLLKELKRSSRRAQEENIQTQAIFNNLSAVAVLYDRGGVIQLANSYAIAMFGFDPMWLSYDSILPRLAIVDEFGKPISIDQMPAAQAAQGQVVLNKKMVILNPRGRKYTVLASSMPMQVGNEITGVVSVLNDISLQERLLEENIQQKNLLENIIQHAPVGIALFDGNEHRVKMSNPLFEKIAQESEDEETVQEQATPDLIRPFMPVIEEITRTGTSQRIYDLPAQIMYGKGRADAYYSYIFTPLLDQKKQVESVLALIWETSEQVKNRQQLQAERDRLSALLQSISDEVWYCDPSGHTTLLSSPGSEREMGYRVFNSAGHAEAFEVFDSGGNPVHFENSPIIKALMGENQHGIEILIQTATGEVHFREYTCAPIRSKNGQLFGAVALMRDITERKQMEQAILEREERIRILTEYSPDLIWSALPDGTADYVNPAWVEYTGLTLDELNRQGWASVNHPEDAQRLSAGWEKATREGNLFEDVFRYRRHDGEYRWFWGRMVPVKDAEGHLTKWVGFTRDITERREQEELLRRSEMQLRESEAHFRVALASVQLLVYTCDRQLRYTWVYNPLRGFRPEDVLGKRDDEILSPEAAAELIEAKQSAIETGQGSVREVRVPFANEDFIYILTTDPIKDENGQVVGLTCSAVDISEQRHLELEQRERAMQMEVQRRLSEYREKERQVIARDIHDGPIQTLVSTIFNLQFAKEAFPDPALQVELEQIGLSMKSAVRELREVLNELRPPSLIRFGLTKAVRVQAEEFRERHPHISFIMDMQDDQGRLSEHVCLTLFRIIQEGLNNIVRHSEASEARIDFKIQDDVAVLEIIDNGKGFNYSGEFTELVHQNHFGLAGMKERAEAVGGHFALVSRPQEGTTILVEVPVKERT